MRENPKFFNSDFWKQRRERNIGQPPKDLDEEQLTMHRSRIQNQIAHSSLPFYGVIATLAIATPVIATPVLPAQSAQATGAYSYLSFPYIPAPHPALANPYFPPPPGYYSGYSPGNGYYCLAYPTKYARPIPTYGAILFFNLKPARDTSATTDEATNHDDSAELP
jgi:hypothetical protein